jgi:hypothetical protein
MEKTIRNTLKESLKNEEVIEHKREDDMSELEEDNISKMTEAEQKENALTDDLKQKVIAYVRIDDLIKTKQQEIKNLKELKKPCEEVIIKFFDETELDFFDLGKNGDKITKHKIEQKAPLKLDIIKDAIKEHLIKEKMVETEERCTGILNDIAELIDKKRPVKTKVSVRRTIPKEKKPKKK